MFALRRPPFILAILQAMGLLFLSISFILMHHRHGAGRYLAIGVSSSVLDASYPNNYRFHNARITALAINPQKDWRRRIKVASLSESQYIDDFRWAAEWTSPHAVLF